MVLSIRAWRHRFRRHGLPRRGCLRSRGLGLRWIVWVGTARDKNCQPPKFVRWRDDVQSQSAVGLGDNLGLATAPARILPIVRAAGTGERAFPREVVALNGNAGRSLASNGDVIRMSGMRRLRQSVEAVRSGQRTSRTRKASGNAAQRKMTRPGTVVGGDAVEDVAVIAQLHAVVVEINQIRGVVLLESGELDVIFLRVIEAVDVFGRRLTDLVLYFRFVGGVERPADFSVHFTGNF